MHLEPKSKQVDLRGIYGIQILSYRINSIIASLSLSAKQNIKQDSGMLLLSEALNNLDYGVEHSGNLNLKSINTVVNSDKPKEMIAHEGTLQHQLNLLLALSSELKLYFNA
ncbi:hypothetical protein D3C71_1638630 [compost metagenome]